MKLNMNKNFIALKGEPMKEKINETIAMYMFSLSQVAGNPATREQKLKAYNINKKINDNPSEVDITTEEASFIKDVCAENLTAGAYGQIEDLIENNN